MKSIPDDIVKHEPKKHTDDEWVVCKNAEELFYGTQSECEPIFEALGKCADYFTTYFLYTRKELEQLKREADERTEREWGGYCEWQHGDTWEMGEL